MELKEQEITLAGKLINDYIKNEEKLLSYFEHMPTLEQAEKRAAEVNQFPRNLLKLSKIIRSYMEPFGISDAAERHLSELEQGALTVVTGQQAGLFTGPLYTVHKAISAIVLAKQASDSLNRKVVPVFWIAGEDHDLAEIAHVYREVNGRVDKLNFPHTEYGKQSASVAVMNKERLGGYLEEYFRSMPETAHSKELFSLVRDEFEKANTFTDFFAALLNNLFYEEGLLFIDAALPALRRHETDYFKVLINEAEAIAGSVYETEQRLQQDGYSAGLGAVKEAANLFVTIRGERILLEREGEGFIGNNGKIRFSKEELLFLAENNPEQLSNNVVTRPLMQEMVFPVLAFVGGPGEIAYWAALKGAFHAVGLEMPIVMPRMTMTVLNRQVQAILTKYEIEVEAVLNQGEIQQRRAALQEEAREEQAERLIDQAEQELISRYEALQQEFATISKGLLPVVEKNLSIHSDQFAYLRRKLNEEVLQKHDVQLRDYRTVEHALTPNGGFQERIYGPVPFMNEYGPDFVKHLARLPFNYDNTHKFIYL